MTPWTRQASLSFTISQSLLRVVSTESMMPSNHLILRCPLYLLPSIFPSRRVFFNESFLSIRWPKYWSLSLGYSGLTSFRIDWFDLFAVQKTRKSLLQHHSSKASILWHSAFFMVQLSHLYMTTGKFFSYSEADIFLSRGPASKNYGLLPFGISPRETTGVTEDYGSKGRANKLPETLGEFGDSCELGEVW